LIQSLPVPVTFTLSNYGKRPAEIQKIVGRVCAIAKFDEIPVGDFSHCKPWYIPSAVVRSSEAIAVSSPFGAFTLGDLLTFDEQQEIVEEKKILVAYGQISYRDVGGAALPLSDFFWTYSVLTLAEYGRGGSFRGPEDRNRRH
jgi:hypothetical protein